MGAKEFMLQRELDVCMEDKIKLEDKVKKYKDREKN